MADPVIDARIAAARAHVQLFAELARELEKRDAEPKSLFIALVDADIEPDPNGTCVIVEVGRAYLVRYVCEVDSFGDGTIRADFVPVNGRYERRTGLALFAQLLMNGAVDLRDQDAVIDVFRAADAGRPILTEADLAEMDDAFANETADKDLAQVWEPPHFAGRTLRFCYDDLQGSFSAVTVDIETCAVAADKRGNAPVYYEEGRRYVADDRQIVAALVVESPRGRAT